MLVETLDQSAMNVVSVGGTIKKRVPLASFLRGPHRRAVLNAVLHSRSKGVALEDCSSLPGSTIVVDPVRADDGRVHGLRLLIHRSGFGPPPERPTAWAFNWYLDRGLSSRPVAALPGSAPSDQHSFWTIGEALQAVDLGERFAEVSAMVLRAEVGSWLQDNAIRQSEGGGRDLVNFTAMLFKQPHPEASTTARSERVMRGLTLRLGSADDNSVDGFLPRTVSDVASDVVLQHARVRHGEYVALGDVQSLAIQRWVSAPHPRIAWQTQSGELPSGLDPRDAPEVEALSSKLAATPHGTPVDAVLRYRCRDGVYRPFTVHAARAVLDEVTSVAVLVFSRDPATDLA